MVFLTKMNFIVDHIFLCFPLFVLLSFLVGYVRKDKVRAVNKDIRNSGFILVSITSLIFFVLLIIQILNPDTDILGSRYRIGPYHLLVVSYFIVLFLMPQLLWIRAMRELTLYIWLMIILFVIVLNFEKVITTVTSLHRDHSASIWYYDSSVIEVLKDWVVRIFVFSIPLVLIYLSKKKK
jgi:hypothetical protein